jgi:hypothetical protein
MARNSKAKENAYQKEYNRKRTADEDFMRNLLAMGTPSSIVPHAEMGECDICRNKSIATLHYPHELIEICKRHEQMRRNGKTR